MTRHDWDYIEWRMPLPRGLQAQAIWHDMEARRAQFHGHPGHFTQPLILTGGTDYTALAG